MVDCRDCKYFVSIDKFDDKGKAELEEKLNVQVVYRERQGKSIKGYCLKQGIVITYYKGHCRLFEPRESKIKQTLLFPLETEIEQV